MAKRTRKVGICGKYGTRYGASLRKVVKKEPGQIFSFQRNPLLDFFNDLGFEDKGFRGLVKY